MLDLEWPKQLSSDCFHSRQLPQCPVGGNNNLSYNLNSCVLIDKHFVFVLEWISCLFILFYFEHITEVA